MSYWKRLGKSVVVGLISFSLLSVPGLIVPARAQAQSVAVYTWASLPAGTIGVSRPEVQLKMQFPGLVLSSYSMSINGKSVPAVYDRKKEAFSYTPAAALAQGAHSVALKVQFKGYTAKTYRWSFTVKPHAVAELPGANAKQNNALAAINALRTGSGLAKVQLHDKLNLTAAAHANYQQLNGQITHVETRGKAGYIGETVGDRTAYYGYSAPMVAEDISMQATTSASAATAIQDLYDAPYHRVPFLNPALTDIGYSQNGKFHVLLFGMQESPVVPVAVVSPVGTNVPASWNGHETPDPLRYHSGVRYPIGYPILTGVYGKGIKRVVPVSASLVSSGGKAVTLLINESSKDSFLTNEVLYLPKSPLTAGTTYKVKVTMKAYHNDGTSKLYTKEWSFTTAP